MTSDHEQTGRTDPNVAVGGRKGRWPQSDTSGPPPQPEDSEATVLAGQGETQAENESPESTPTLIGSVADEVISFENIESRRPSKSTQNLQDDDNTPDMDSAPAGRSADNVRGIIIGDYEVLRLLGRGGMGVVYQARHRKLDRVVALKMILAGKHAGADALQRFISEARAVAHLQHPGIVQIFDIGEHNGLPYFSLEFVDGTDLHRNLSGQPRSAKSAAELLVQLCDAMQYAHNNHILHRDLKPANILLDQQGRPKITDFGLAKRVDPDASVATSDGTIMGSPSYMPPEQARGEISSVSPRSDLYSLGAVLYQMLTGRPPFLSDRPLDTVMQVIHNEVVSPRQLQPGIPIDLETICLKALQKNPAARYGDCRELAADLQRFLNGEPILARPVSRLNRAWRWCRRNPRIALPSSVASLLIIVTAVVSTWAWSVTSAQATLIAQERDNVREQRDEAERQQILASEAQLQAEKNQQLAEKQAMLALQNIQLVVTEIDDRLAKEPGMSEIRIGMLQVVEKKWDELDLAMAGGLQGQAIPTLMAVRSKIADAWVSLDKLQEADNQYTIVHRQAQERLVVKNRNDAARFNLALVCLRWAPIRQRLFADPARGDLLLDESLTLLRDILNDPRPEPGSPATFQIADVLQQTLMRSAAAAMKQGALRRADRLYSEVGELCSGVVAQMDEDAPWVAELPEDRRALIRTYFEQNLDLSRTGRANLLCRLGKVDEAIPLYESVIDRRRENVERVPGDRNSRDQLALQLRNYGQYMLRTGRTDDAARLLGQSNDLAERNYNEDPANAGLKRSFGHSQYYLGTARDVQGHAAEALALFERSRVLRREMYENSPDHANKVNLMLSEARVGNVDAAEALINELTMSESQDPDLRLDLARALAQLTRQTSGEQQQRLREAALNALDRCINDGLSDPFSVAAEPDLIPLRGEDQFAAVISRLQTIRERKESAD